MGTEALTGHKTAKGSLSHKLDKYRKYFATGAYRSFERVFDCQLRGFRTLIVTRGRSRCAAVCRVVREMGSCDFVLVSDDGALERSGAWADVWCVGGQLDRSRASILGSQMPQRDDPARRGWPPAANRQSRVLAIIFELRWIWTSFRLMRRILGLDPMMP
jgi:hypothetical protein